jgi:hypothetical protein
MRNTEVSRVRGEGEEKHEDPKRAPLYRVKSWPKFGAVRGVRIPN